MGPEGGEGLARPADVGVGGGRVRPDRGEQEVPARVAVRDGGLRGADAGHRAVEVLEQHRRHRGGDGGEPLDGAVDEGVRQSTREAREPVVERPVGVPGIEQRVHHGVRRGPDLGHQGRSPGHERRQLALRGVRVSGVEDHEGGELGAGAVRRVHEAGEDAQVVGGTGDRIAVDAQQLGGGVDRVGDQPAGDRSHGVKTVREGGGDAEVAAAAAQRPEEVGVRGASTSSTSPAAVTSSTASRWSDASLYLAISQPIPPPRV